MTNIVYAGAEIGSNRTLLFGQDVVRVNLNFAGLRKRGMPTKKTWLISEHFPENALVYVDSGASSIDKDAKSKEEIEAYAAEYQEFIVNNLDRITGFTELDSQVMFYGWVEQQRAFYEGDPKMWPVFHEAHGLPVLKQLSSTFENVAIPFDTVEKMTNLATLTRSYQREFGTHYHGLGIAKPDNLRQIPFDTVSTLAWISPMRRGETIVWDGQKINRYPKKMKAQARPRYKAMVDTAGLDFTKFIDDDTLESTKVAIWSYQQLEKSMEKKPPNLHVLPGGKKDDDPQLVDNKKDDLWEFLGTVEIASTNKDMQIRNSSPSELVQRPPEEMQILPGFGFESRTVREKNAEGALVSREVDVAISTGVSLRQCNTCFVAANCPAFQPDHSCAFKLPIEVKTKEQLTGVLTAILEMQAARVAFMNYAEQTRGGGYADPNLSLEIDRLYKLVANIQEMSTDKETLRIDIERASGAGVLSALFGDRASALKAPDETITDAEITQVIRHEIED